MASTSVTASSWWPWASITSVAAGANVYQFDRFETADGFCWLRTLRDGNDDVNPGVASDLDLILGSVAFALDAHGLGVMKQAVQQG